MKRLSLFAVILYSCLHGAAQNTFIAFTRFSIDDGMASTVTHSIYQDHKGFMWVGTANGLQRFDGRKFVYFSSNPKGDALPQAVISQIIGLPDSTLMICTNDLKEIGIFNPYNFLYKKVPVKTEKEVWARASYKLVQDDEGNVFLQILRYPAVLWYDKKNNCFTEKNSPVKSPGNNWLINSLWIDKERKQYWYSCDSGLAVYDAASKQLYNRHNNPWQHRLLTDPAINEKNTVFFHDSKDRYWIISWPTYANGGEAFLCFDPRTNQFTKDTAGWATAFNTYTEKYGITELKTGGIWIYGAGALANYNTQLNRFVNNRTSFLDNFGIRYDFVTQIYEDNEGGVWVTTDQGLYYSYIKNDDAVLNYMLTDKLDQVNPTGYCQLSNKEILITTWGTGVIRMNENLGKLTPLFSNNKDGTHKLTWCVLEHKLNKKIYVGCQAGALIIYDPATQNEKVIHDSVFAGKTIRQVVQDKEGTLYFGTQFGRIVKYKDDKFTLLTQLNSTIVQKLIIDKEGRLWAAMFNDGVYIIDPVSGKIIRHFVHDETKPTASLYNNIATDLWDTDSLMYVATGGLSVINKRTNTVSIISTNNGLPSNSIQTLQQDASKNFWFTTATGLVRYNPLSKSFTSFGKKDAIVNAELLTNPSFQLTNGKIIFAGTNQLLVINPSRLMTSTIPPDVTITDFKLLDEYMPVDSLLRSGVKLNHFQNTIAISFASLSFQQRDKLLYYYKLDGIDKEWTQADATLTVRYSLLPPGKYTFVVKCVSSDGVTSKDITSFPIIITPPFWRTGWFASTVLFFIALFIYTLHNLRVTKLLAVEKIRNRVARDLHDDMGSTLSTINILSSMAKAKITTDTVKTSEYINKISDNSQRMMEAMDDIVWAIKPANDSMQKIVARMREFATSVLEAKEIDIDFTVDEAVQDITLDMEQRRDLFLLFKEAVNNVAKYSRCNNATIQVLVKDKKLLLRVSDDGVGFDLKSADTGNGLGNMLKRADALHGRVEITSAPGNGTEVKLTVPIN